MEIIEEVIDDIIEIINLDRATLREAEELKFNVSEKINAGYNKIIIDLTAVEFLDSTFRVIVNTLRKLLRWAVI